MISALLLATLELSPILSDRMVLQAETAVPIWGKADPGAKVQVSFRGKTASAKAGADGAFSAQLFGFGERLQAHFNCPVGLIEAASNGSPSGPFLPKEGFPALGFETEISK